MNRVDGRNYGSEVAISHYLVPLVPDDPILEILRRLEAEHRADANPDDDDPLGDDYVDALNDHPDFSA